MKNYAEEDEHNTILQKLESCPKKQLIDFAKQPVEILQQDELPKEWMIPRDLLVDNIIGQMIRECLLETLSQITANSWLLYLKLNLNI